MEKVSLGNGGFLEGTQVPYPSPRFECGRKMKNLRMTSGSLERGDLAPDSEGATKNVAKLQQA